MNRLRQAHQVRHATGAAPSTLPETARRIAQRLHRLHRLLLCGLCAALLLGGADSALAQVSVAAGLALYGSKGCAGCHGAGVNLQKVLNGANFPGAVARGFGNATMAGAFDDDPMTAAPPRPTAGEQLSLALYIGQFKAPLPSAGSLAVKPGSSATIDVHGLLPSDGSSGAARDADGVSATNGARGTTTVAVAASSSAIAYNITYTATSATFVGSDSFSYTVTNATAASESKTVSVTIANTDPPAVSTDPAVLAGVCDVDFSAQIVATNPPLTAFAAEGLPAGMSVDTSSGRISGKPQALGTFALKLSATNDIGSGSVNVELTIGCPPPVAAGGAFTVPLNTPTTFDMAAQISGFAVTGITVVAPTRHGTLAVNGTKLTYTPRHNYFGPDSFSYIAFGAGGASQPALATLAVVGRPDPAQDPDVRGLIAAQAESARRFSRVQIENIQRRLETLHRGSADAAAPERRAALPSPAIATAANAARAATNAATFATAATAADPHTAAGAAAPPPGSRVPAGWVAALLAGAQTRSIDLAAVDGLRLAAQEADTTGAGADSGAAGLWLGGSVRLGRRDGSPEQSGLEFSSSGVTVGYDRRISPHWLLGLGLGFARDETTVGSAGSRHRARGTALALYGSYLLRPNTFVDAVIGHGPLRMDSHRAVLPIDDVARAQRKGEQSFGSIAAAYEHRDGRLLVSPYARLDIAASRLRDATESGAGLYALTYFAQRIPTRRLSLGLRLESAHDTFFGSVQPRVRLEAQREFEAVGAALLAYADQAAGPQYTVAPRALERNALVLGLGADVQWPSGLTLGLDYRVLTAGGKKDSQSIGLQLSQAFGGDVGPRPGGLAALASDPLDLQIDAGLSLDNNVNRGRDGELRLSDLSLRVNVHKDHVLRLGEFSQAALRGTLGAESFRRYTDLSRVLAELQAELRYRASGDFLTPTYTAFGRAALENHVSALRDGSRYAVGLTARVPITDRIGALGSVSHNVRRGRSAVFDLTDSALRLNLDYRAAPTRLVYAALEWRRGDTVSSGLPTLVDLDVAEVFVVDGAFGPRELRSYRVDADTWIARVGGNWRLGADSSVDLSWTRSQSSPRTQPGFAGAPTLRYGADQLRLAYIVRY